ncbi:MAG: Nif3-like dinuclear metal center hexameric protein [Alistipes sp.]|nr:Nif3-like dinuclear metal center hexameric protein [Candidatus Alistipes equi]
MKVEDITTIIEQFAPLSLQEDYDNSGLVVGRPNQDVLGILLAVDVTEEVLDEAIEKNCNMVITHHPIIFHGQKRFNSQTLTQRCVERAISEGIALYAAHTNLDAAPNGMSWRLAEILGLHSVTLLSEGHVLNSGFGVVGELSSAWDEVSYLGFVKQKLQAEVVRHSDLLGKPISRVAICTGAGASLMERAVACGAQLYITSDLKYNDFYSPDGRLVVADVGHFESERCAIDILFDILSKKISKFALHRSIVARTPIHCI